MNKAEVDNSIFSDLSKCITWQYDKAHNLVGLIMAYKDSLNVVQKGIIKGFFDISTNGFWTNWRLNIIDIDNANDFGLAIWGKLLGVPRPTLAEDTELGTEQQTLPTEIYRKLLKARFRLLGGDATMTAYEEYVQTLFNGNVKIDNPGDMSLIFTEKNGLSNIEKAFIRQYRDIAFVFPSGVKDNVDATGLVFGFKEQHDAGDTNVGGLNNSTFNWR